MDKSHIFKDNSDKSLCGLYKSHVGSIGQFSSNADKEIIKKYEQIICKKCLRFLKKIENSS